jgi:flagellar biosynthesis/type III secretory pathway M-ring protein FliF/YscJ
MKRTYKTSERNRVRRIAKLRKADKSNMFRKHIKSYSILWNILRMSQRISIVVIAVAVIVGVITIFDISISPKYSKVPVIDAPIKDKAALNSIVVRIKQEGIKTSVTSDGLILVADESTARRMKDILIREDLIPTGIDPWDIFDKDRCTITDLERNVRLQRSLTQEIRLLIKANDDIDDAKLIIRWPKKELFLSNQEPVAVCIVTPKLGSDITQNRKKIEGIQKILKIAVEGLQDENIIITDQNGLMLNDFTYMAELDQLMLTEREAKFIKKLEAEYRTMLLHVLQQVFSPDRVRDLHIELNLTQGERNPNISRITVSVNIDGKWKWKYDEKGKPVILPSNTIEREYTPVPAKDLRFAEALIRDVIGAIGYNSARGDTITVHNIPFDRLKEFSEEDEAYFRQKQIQMTVIIILSGLALLLVSFIIFRGVARHKEVIDAI